MLYQRRIFLHMAGLSSLRYFRLRGMHKQERLLARGCAIFWLAVLEADISPRISPYPARGCAIFCGSPC